MKITRRQLRELIQEAMGPIPFNPGERRNLPGIADDVHNELLDAEVINFPTNESDNIFDKVVNIALNAKNAESVETLNLDVKRLFTKERDANGILASFVSEMSSRMSKQGIEFDDERQMLHMQATEGAADLVDSMLGVSLDIPENKAIHLQHASDATEMLMDALQNLNLV